MPSLRRREAHRRHLLDAPSTSSPWPASSRCGQGAPVLVNTLVNPAARPTPRRADIPNPTRADNTPVQHQRLLEPGPHAIATSTRSDRRSCRPSASAASRPVRPGVENFPAGAAGLLRRGAAQLRHQGSRIALSFTARWATRASSRRGPSRCRSSYSQRVAGRTLVGGVGAG